MSLITRKGRPSFTKTDDGRLRFTRRYNIRSDELEPATINTLVFLLGFFIDFFEIAFIVVPLLLPVAKMLDINLVWFGIILAMNLQTSFLTPPFGFSLFYLRAAAPKEITTGQIYRGVIPFICLQIVGVAVIWLLPSIATWLPGIVF